MENQWLSKDERRLLAGYYRNIEKLDCISAFETRELGKLFSWRRVTIPQYDEDKAASERKAPDDFHLWSRRGRIFWDRLKRLQKTNDLLTRRQLIRLTDHIEWPADVVVITLTLEGYDLGKKYDNWFECSQLWWEQYKSHWLIAACVGILIGALGQPIIGKIRSWVSSEMSAHQSADKDTATK